MKRLIPLILILMISLACNLSDITINLTAEPPNTIQPATIPPSPTLAPVVTLPAIPTEPAPTQPIIQPDPGAPIAIAIVQEESALLSILNPEGQVLGEIRAAGLENAEPGRAHFAGKWSAGQPPLVYYTFANGGQILVHAGGQNSLVTNAPMFISLAGAPGEPILAYSTGEFSQIGLHSQLFVSPMNTLSAAGAVVSHDDPESRAIYPLAIRTQGGAPGGVWYTLRPWGIGGDIVFDPSDGLYYVDLGNGTTLDYNEHIQRNTSLSPDHAWAASEAGGTGNITFRIYNLETGKEHDFPLLPASDRGAGYGVFSPSSQHVAWMEGSGWQMAEIPNFHATIRIATTGGEWLVDFPDTTLAALLGTPVTWAQPMGWLNDQVLVLQVRGATWRDAMVVLLDITASQAVQLSPGTFAAFVYP